MFYTCRGDLQSFSSPFLVREKMKRCQTIDKAFLKQQRGKGKLSGLLCSRWWETKPFKTPSPRMNGKPCFVLGMFTFSLKERFAHISPKDQRSQENTDLTSQQLKEKVIERWWNRERQNCKLLLGVDDNKCTKQPLCVWHPRNSDSRAGI